jgi:hypothetical protein
VSEDRSTYLFTVSTCFPSSYESQLVILSLEFTLERGHFNSLDADKVGLKVKHFSTEKHEEAKLCLLLP